MGILALPFFAPFVLAGWDPLDLGLLVHGGHVVAAIVEILATLVLWSLMRRFATPRWSLTLVLLYFLATSVRTVASQALWQHSGVHLAVVSALWLVLREEAVKIRVKEIPAAFVEQKSSDPEESVWRATLASLILPAGKKRV